ncbi:hypothetical protein OAJ57_02440 [Alphaproteobacteria bacterium]|nr:hypothetical protein [Alphaproteobacteria bacterium]
MARKKKFNRSAEDLGNIVELEHVNVTIPDQTLATLFYVTGLGLTRDPFQMTSVTNMWVNAGQSQFHLPTRGEQVLRGRIGLVMPNLDGLVKRLESVRGPLEHTQFDYAIPNGNDVVDVICPWGNRFRCHLASEAFAPMAFGMPYVQFDVPQGSAKGIARFYREMLGAGASVGKWDRAKAARIGAGYRQELIFRETKQPIPDFDQHHIQIYIADFSGPHKRLLDRGLVTEESNQWQYRFEDITDLDDDNVLFTIEHEVRSMTHPLYARPKLNRNPDETIRNYMHGQETIPWTIPYNA